MALGTMSGLALGALTVGVGLLVGGLSGWLVARLSRRGRAHVQALAAAEFEAARIRAQADGERLATLREADIGAREDAMALRTEAESLLARRLLDLSQKESALLRRQAATDAGLRQVEDARVRLARAADPLAAHHAQAAASRQDLASSMKQARALLEGAAGQTADALRPTLLEAEREEVRGQAANALRLIEQSTNDPEQSRRAVRVMGISVGRFSGHYLTERHLSNIGIGAPRDGRPAIAVEDLQLIEAVSNVKLTLAETQDAVRLEGLDGVGKEVARRCLAGMLKRPGLTGDAVTRMARDIAGGLDREVADLGRRAFSVLEIPRAHPDIVKLVGRLNYRTSFTQNQWKHAIEAALLCGMMAEELGLNLKVARRAALMHDIGKALTHELDGSHAVIGADYARRLGETEIVANAIGAHHTDEPFASPYAYLVAAADAMSGARPGARRQMDDNYAAKLGDLERITRGFQGVAEAFAVQGGREVRVYVKQERMDDLAAVKLSSEIADTISREMTFPGQIRVTVIREFKAVENAN